MSFNYSYLYNKVITNMTVTSSMITLTFNDETQGLFTVYCSYTSPNQDLGQSYFDLSQLSGITPNGYKINSVSQQTYGIVLETSKVIDSVTYDLSIPLILGADHTGIQGCVVVAVVI